MKKFISSWIVAAICMYLVSLLFGSRMGFPGGFWSVVWASLLVGLLNAVLVPVLKVVTCPIWLLTLGLLRFIVNGVILLIADSVIDGFYIAGFWWAVLAAILISLFTTVINGITGREKRKRVKNFS